MTALLALSLAHLLAACAPAVGPRTMSAVVSVESGGDPLAIHDNTTGRALHAPDRRTAVGWSNYLIAHRHSVDLGLAQINDANLPRLGMSVVQAFDPCANLHGAATILSFEYGRAIDLFGPGQFALRRALAAYNTGSLFAGQTYIDKILVAAGIDPQGDQRVPDLAGRPLAARAVQVRRSVRPVALAPLRPAPARSAAPKPGPPALTPQQSGILVRVERLAVPLPSPEPDDPNAPLVLRRALPADPAAPAPTAPVPTASAALPASAPLPRR